MNKLTRKEKQQQQKAANRARHRLRSIQHDVETFLRPTLEQHVQLQNLPIIANERCGSWYTDGLSSCQYSCYFKSTDGHVGTYAFSLKRLNLNVIDIVSQHGSCIIVDASVQKEMPDSFTRTIPIWCTVLNRIAARFRREFDLPIPSEWDDNLYTPEWIVSKEEHETMHALIDTRVQELYDCKAIVDPRWLATTLDKPLRPVWMTPLDDNLRDLSDEYYTVTCLNASRHFVNRTWNEEQAWWYTPGGADDHEAWARRLTPQVFWSNVDTILNGEMTDDEVDRAIDVLVEKERQENEAFEVNTINSSNLFDAIGDTNIAVGTRRAGRPPECWQHFDAILNVTHMQYEDIYNDCAETSERFYLQLPVKEGKRDKSELERWMVVGIVYCLIHARENRRILIHCAQGKDRSVAVAMAVIVLFCDLAFPLRWKDDFWRLNVDKLIADNEEESLLGKGDPRNKSSGLSNALISGLQGREGRDLLLKWVQQEFGHPVDDDSPLATKETLRITLHLLRQDREKAEPSRSTIQKLNRFFMSGIYDASRWQLAS
jgi:tRNA A64-2'-O-ribosylphosphate transferase